MDLDKPLLIYDGDCGFCRRWIERWRGITGNALDYAPYQEVGGRFPGITPGELGSSVILVEPGEKITRGAEAVFRSLATARSHRWPLWVYHHLPGAKPAAETFYRLVASHRVFFSAISRFFWGDSVLRPSYSLSRFFFLRGLGLVYFIAFASLGVQILGLLGSNGIWPARGFLSAVHEQAGSGRFWSVPTLAWLNTSDAFLRILCWAGAASSIFVVFGVLPAFFLFLNWLLYLSLIGVGGPFLSFQWDILLLETGFLAIFFSPLTFRMKLSCGHARSDLIRFLLKLLLFKLMFLSGVVKLASNDPAWRSLTALRYHYETQPLPPWTAWYAHHWSAWFQTASCIFVFAVELAAPFFIFLPRRLRHLSAGFLISLQLLIMFTGNYTFFNLLTLLLCLLLFEDLAWPKKLVEKIKNSGTIRVHDWPRLVTGAVGLLILLMTFGALRSLEPFRLVNRYGLFAVMTTQRPEIILEGSEDGKVWQAYEFKFKIGDLHRRPSFVAPHQPRLDWQMWFAALGNYKQNNWFIRLCGKLLEGSPDVLRLLEKDPFPGQPPKFIRALVYDYHFTSAAERQKTGDWWRRELKGLYCSVMAKS